MLDVFQSSVSCPTTRDESSSVLVLLLAGTVGNHGEIAGDRFAIMCPFDVWLKPVTALKVRQKEKQNAKPC